MDYNYDDCIVMLLHHEGGYINHPEDPGGETNLGVTKRVYDEWGGTKDMKSLTPDDVAPIYRENYWNRLKCDDLPSGLDFCVFDWGVNSGTGRAAKAIQKVVGANPDGAIGPKTLALIKGQNTEYMIEEFGKIRQAFYESLSTFKTFGKGWTRRNKETTEASLGMVQ